MKFHSLLSLVAGAALVSGCATTVNNGAPVTSSIRNKEGSLVVIFRNVGRQIVSFDYTIADQVKVPHVDADGPNSGLVENLYPGAEKEVANPLGKSVIWAKVGRPTYGKRSAEELAQIYRPGSLQTGIAGEPSLMPSSSTTTTVAVQSM